MKLETFFSRIRTILLLFTFFIIAGLYSYITIPKESYPDVQIPIVYTTATLRGISPEDAEKLIVKPLEQELRSIEGIKEMTSQAFEGGATVMMEFEAGIDIDQALLDVRNKVDDAKPDLPSNLDNEPSVHEINLSQFPILVISLSGNLPERALLKAARSLKNVIEAIPSVLEVDIGGERTEQVEIIMDPAIIENYHLSAQEFGNFLMRSNSLIAAGNLDIGKGRFAIKVPGLIEDIEDIMDMPIKTKGDAIVRIKDIATIRDSFEDSEGYARVDGNQSLTLEISKRTGENLIRTINQVKEIIEKEKNLLPPEIKVEYMQNHAEMVKITLNDLENSVLLAILLVMIIIVISLGIRTGILVGMAIPASFLLGIFMLSFVGITINMVVLYALILSVGMLVDAAIIIAEYADRQMVNGSSKKEAYIEASRRMGMPVIASTLTTLCAFLPLAFWPGIAGEFMKYLPFTLLATLTASMFVALLLIPALGVLYGKKGALKKEDYENIIASEEGKFEKLTGMYKKYEIILKKVLTMPGKVVSGFLLFFFFVMLLMKVFGAGVIFFPEAEPDQLAINIHARGNLSVDEKDGFVREVENRILPLPYFKSVYARSGFSPRDAAEDTIGTINLELLDWQERPKASKIIKEMQEKTKDIAGLKIEIMEQEQGPSQGKPIQIELRSTYSKDLEAGVEYVLKGLNQMDGLRNIEDNRPLPGIQWEIEVDRAQAVKFGVDIQSVGDMVQLVTKGLKFTDYRPDTSDEEVDIVARYPEKYRSLEQIKQLRVITENGSVPISSFVTITPKPKVSTIYHTDTKRTFTVKADVQSGVLVDQKIKEFQSWMEKNPPQEKFEIAFKGEEEDKKETSAFLMQAFFVVIFLMLILLVTQFNSFYSSFVILFAIVMSLSGVLIGLILTHTPFGIVMTGVGVVALAGIVVNDNIVLIDTYDQLKKEIKDPVDRILRTGIQRLRPVLLTTITTILGLLPMLFKLNIDFIHREITIGSPSMEWWSQLSLAIISGLTITTVLTLIITPSLLLLKEQYLEKKCLKNKSDSKALLA